ncbi:hypothetical protein JD969_05280 [Planctomycetota bacterium]|nr:hypothetical protein JD969_05280 [Planctomycetota bacterium]
MKLAVGSRLLNWFRTYWWVIAPLLFITLYCIPLVTFLLPATESYFGETYQPLRALKFFASKGQDYHKYGPLPNFLLAPTYTLTLANWYILGTFTSPSTDFPYGFENPLRQLSFLILQGRVLFLILALVTFAITLHQFTCITKRTYLIALAFMLLIATNINDLLYSVNTRPDGPMVWFALLSLLIYCKIIFDKLTVKRAFWMSVFASLAITSKALIGPMFLLPYLALGIQQYIHSRKNPEKRSLFWRSIAYTLVAGFGTYLLLNVIYAPSTWYEQMTHWVGGEGTSSAIWGGGLASGELSYTTYLTQIAIAILNNLGPGGTIVILITLILFPFMPGKYWYMLIIPPISVFFLALLPLGYVVDRFYIVFTLALLPFIISQFDSISTRIHRLPLKYIINAAALILLVFNMYWATFAFIRPQGNPQAMIEHDLQNNVNKNTSINILSLHPQVPGKNRLYYLGYNLNTHSLAQIINDSPITRPGIIYANKGQLDFILDAQKYPQRAQMLIKESDLDIGQFTSIQSLGYQLKREVSPTTPIWFKLDFMPIVHDWHTRNTLLVFERINNTF